MNNLKEKIINILKNNRYIYIGRRLVLAKRNEIFYSKIEKKEKYIEKIFKKKLGYEINFYKEPQTFNQKIQFRKLYDNNPLYSVCADKYAVREYIKEKIGEKYLIPLYLVTDELTYKQWEKLPNSFVVKPTHDNGTVRIVKDKNKADKIKIIKDMKLALKLDYGKVSMEEYYSKIPRKILVEKYLKADIEDYKFHCFKDKIFLERITKIGLGSMYDIDKWENLKFSIGYKVDSKTYSQPYNFKEMLRIARKLSEEFEYVRVDLYNVDGKIYVGELTFCESSGFGKFTNVNWDHKFGSYWKQKKLK